MTTETWLLIVLTVAVVLLIVFAISLMVAITKAAKGVKRASSKVNEAAEELQEFVSSATRSLGGASLMNLVSRLMRHSRRGRR